MGESDKRSGERVTGPGQLLGEVTVYEPMTILDISDGGAQVETSFALHNDSLHDFRLTLDDRSVVVKGRVAYCKIAELTGGGVMYSSGIEFVEPAPHVLAAIREFVEVHRNRPTRIIDAELA